VTQARGRTRIGWELVRLLQESLMALEETASRVLAAQVAGTIALWTQLHTFEEGAPKFMAWAALLLWVSSICFLGLFLRPRKVVRFWDRAIPDEVFAVKRPVTLQEEEGLIEHMSTTMRRQRDSLERGVQISIPLGVIALCLVTVAYAVDKHWYPP
jgi:hypothetical protein